MPPASTFYQIYFEYYTAFENGILVYYLAVNGIYLLLFFGAFYSVLRRQMKIEAEHVEIMLQSEDTAAVSLIVPAYNEEETIAFCVQTLFNLSYRQKNIIIVNDGSTDRTLQILKDAYGLRRIHYSQPEAIKTQPVKNFYQSVDYPNLFVVDKFNGGSGDAVNAGINVCSTHYFFVTDADSLVDNEEMSRLLRFMISRTGLAACGGSIRVANGCEIQLRGITKVGFPTNYLASIQVVEYLRSFFVGRMGWDLIGGPIIISGACAFFQTDVVKDLGGFDPEMIGQDFEFTLRYKKEMMDNNEDPTTGFIPEPVIWTEVPTTLKSLGNQRTRWHLGLAQGLWKHLGLTFNPRYGLVGLFSVPFFIFADLFAPIIEFLGYFLIGFDFAIGAARAFFVVYLILLTIGFGWLLSIFCLALEQLTFRKYSSFRDISKFLLFSLMENIGYRQLHVLWRLRAFWRIAASGAYHWGDIARKGFKKIK
jgi:cellulose synthase/poly-beta-1,6-N-acetylglucosamine synthase-like glycosyltransferase